MKGLKYTLLLAGAMALGCGGSNGVSGFPDPPVSSLLLPTGPGIPGGTLMRTLRAGDTWEYDVKGTMLREEYDASSSQISKNSGPVTGTLVRTLSAVSFEGVPAFKMTDALTYKLNGGLISVEVLETYLSQEPSGAITMLGRRQNKVDFDGADQPWLPAAFSAGANVGGFGRFVNTPSYRAANFDDSSAFSVTGAGAVAATTGAAFDTWRAVHVSSLKANWPVIAWARNAGVVTTGFIFDTREDISTTDDWSPVLGAPVKRKYGSSRQDSVIQNDVNYQPPVFDVNGVLTTPESVSYTYHTIKRTLDLEMVLKQRSLQ